MNVDEGEVEDIEE